MTLGEAIAYYESQPPRGEYVLVLEGAKAPAEPEITVDMGVERVRQLMSEGMRHKDAVKQAAKALGLAKNALYEATLEIAAESD